MTIPQPVTVDLLELYWLWYRSVPDGPDECRECITYVGLEHVPDCPIERAEEWIIEVTGETLPWYAKNSEPDMDLTQTSKEIDMTKRQRTH